MQTSFGIDGETEDHIKAAVRDTKERLSLDKQVAEVEHIDDRFDFGL
jgi:hypothetical protein